MPRALICGNTMVCGAPAAWASPADCVRRVCVQTRRLSGVRGTEGSGELASCPHQDRALPWTTRGPRQPAGTGLDSVPGRRPRCALLRAKALCQPCSRETGSQGGTWCQRGPRAGEARLLAGSAGPSSAASRRQGCAPPCAEARRQPGASTSGRGTEYAPDYAGQYDYAPPPGGYRQAPPRGPPPGVPPGGGGGGMDNFTKALIAGAFIMGMGTGVWFNSEASVHPSNVASTEIIDRQTPNSEVCMANGYSSMVFDQRIFVSFNPFNVYVAQPEVKPGCVFRRSNISLLEKKKLVTDKEVGACTRNMNTFAFVGDLERSPEVSCVYHSEDAENQFLRNPKRAAMGDGFQPREDAAAQAARTAAEAQ